MVITAGYEHTFRAQINNMICRFADANIPGTTVALQAPPLGADHLTSNALATFARNISDINSLLKLGIPFDELRAKIIY
jgi:hypothetical protein